jgi:hypothetical protein
MFCAGASTVAWTLLAAIADVDSNADVEITKATAVAKLFLIIVVP